MERIIFASDVRPHAWETALENDSCRPGAQHEGGVETDYKGPRNPFPFMFSALSGSVTPLFDFKRDECSCPKVR